MKWKNRKKHPVSYFLAGMLTIMMTISFLPLQVHAGSVELHDISDGNVKCTNPDVLYRIQGITFKNHVTVSGGTKEKPIQVDLDDLLIDLKDEVHYDSVADSPLTVKSGSYATIYIGKDNKDSKNELYGGNETGVGKDWGYAGLCVEEGAHVTFSGQGYLKAEGGGEQYGAAGIGGNYDEAVTELVFDGNMTIHAKGAYSAPGIGSGRDGELYDLAIRSGNITAAGGRYAPGIGAGDAVSGGSGGTTHNINISGGVIHATGGEHAAGIGGSEDGDCENITISGGDITAAGGPGGAGIGGGQESYVKEINISNAAVHATGGELAAAIGGGNSKAGGDGGDVGTIRIKNCSSFSAQGGKGGAGIGGSDGGDINDIFIEDCTMTAKGGEFAAGIGGGNGSCGNISIKGVGKIDAKGKTNGAGIGGGKKGSVGAITISGKKGGRNLIIVAESGHSQEERNLAAAIGSGNENCGNILIENADILANAHDSGAGIGTGYLKGIIPGNLDQITIKNCKVRAVGGPTTAGVGCGRGGKVSNILIEDSDYDGGAIGGSAYTNLECENTNSMNSIQIVRSNIKAKTANIEYVEGVTHEFPQSMAGIGCGPKGDINEIRIEDSTVYAVGTKGGAGIGNAGEVLHANSGMNFAGGIVKRMVINGSTIEGETHGPGAGVGSGFGAFMKYIQINNSTVNGRSNPERYFNRGGSGVGSGALGNVEKLKIDHSKVEGHGSGGGAGIGSSKGRVDYISITNGSEIEAFGSDSAAGIGSGIEGDVRNKIYIADSTVHAVGGVDGAGIGSGSTGDLATFQAEGKCKIDAVGGVSGAGIGSGRDGSVENIFLNLTTTPDLEYYVKATGGFSAAGIGTGGIDVSPEDAFGEMRRGNSVNTIGISGGHIVANSTPISDGDKQRQKFGNGAGIGGGCRKGTLKHFLIDGGYVEAKAGGTDARDIGNGGSGTEGPLVDPRKDGDFDLYGGTILAENLSKEADYDIRGGSIYGNIKNALDSNGNPVYKTTLQLEDGPGILIDELKLENEKYHYDDMFTDSKGRLYLYLHPSEKMKKSAKVAEGGKTFDYFGTTSTDHKGWLKMKGDLEFKPLEDSPAKNAEFIMELQDEYCSGTKFKFTVNGTASLQEVENAVAPGTRIRLRANDLGEFQVYAEADGEVESPCYWSPSAGYTGQITKSIGEISIVGNPGKVYDGKPAEDPEVRSNSFGKVTYTYYEGTDTTGEKLESAPVHVGTYTVVANLEKTDRHSAAVSEPVTFEITKKEVGILITGFESREDVTGIAKLVGMTEPNGSITFTVKRKGSDAVLTEVTEEIKEKNGECVAEHRFDMVLADDYVVEADYHPGTPEDYFSNGPAVKEYHKMKAYRQITVRYSQSAHYGDPSFDLGATTNEVGPEDEWTYEIRNEMPDVPGNDVVSIDEKGHVTIFNAGKVEVSITLRDGRNPSYYSDATATTYISIYPKNIHVTTYAEKDGKPVDEVPYGEIESLDYKVDVNEKDFAGGMTLDEFTKKYGTIEAVPPITEACVSDTPYMIAADAPDHTENYKILLKYGTVRVVPRNLTIEADPMTGKYGIEPKYQYTCKVKGLMPWDTENTVFGQRPSAFYDKNATGKEYKDLMPGVYKDAVSASKGIQNFNVNGKENYKIQVVPADLTVTKAPAELTLSAESKVYDGKPATVTVSNKDAVLTYYERIAGRLAVLKTAPVNAGSYYVKATLPESDKYEETTKVAEFEISKADPEVEVPVLPDTTFKEGLTLKDEPLPEGWSWKEPSTKITAPGPMVAKGTYLSKDMKNFNSVTLDLTYRVLPTVTGTAVPEDVSAAVSLSTQPGADLYTMMGKPGLDPSGADVIKNGTKTHTETGTTEVVFSDLARNTEYSCYVVAEMKSCRSAVTAVNFRTLRSDRTIKITEDLSRTYDGTPVEDPQVKVTGDGTVLYTYYEGDTITTEPMTEKPVHAGIYTVRASVNETEGYKAAVSAPSTFEISKKEVNIELTGSESGKTAKVTAHVLGLMEENGSIAFQISAGGKVLKEETVPIKKNKNKAEAVLSFDHAGADTYTVEASYVPGTPENYLCRQPAVREFIKNAQERSILTETDLTKTYGDASFKLAVSTDKPGTADSWKYEVVHGGEDPAVSVEHDGTVQVKNAGTATIRITLTENSATRFYNDAETFVTVTVRPADLHISSFAQREGTKVTSAVYGTTKDLIYDLSYKESDFKNGDTKDTFYGEKGTVEAEALSEYPGVKKDPYTIDIHADTCRNYNLILTKGTLLVTPAELTLEAEDAVGKWEEEPSYTNKISGWAAKDTAATVFEISPKAYLDETVTGKPYKELTPGLYKDAVSVTEGKQYVNENGQENYTVKILKGDLTIEKAPVTVKVKATSKVYDGTAAKVTVTYDAFKPYDGTAVLTYYALEDGKETRLDQAPVHAGSYKVVAETAENDNFLAGSGETLYEIRKADPNPEIPLLPDLVIRDGLTLNDVLLPTGWTWKEPEKGLQPGLVKETGIFTPEDTVNYNTAERDLVFRVNPYVTADAEAKDTRAVIHAVTQKDAEIYYLRTGKTDTVTADDVIAQGDKVSAADGKATIELTGLTPNTEYTCHLVSVIRESRSVPVSVTFRTLRSDSVISITGNPAKTYDGTPAEDPQVSKNREGKVTYKYYNGNGTGDLLAGAPVNAGTYTVTASMEETEYYKAAVSEPLVFTIEKKEITLGLTAGQKGTSAIVYGHVFGMLEANGSLVFTINESMETPITTDGLGNMTASVTFDPVPAEEYTISLSYKAGTPENYYCKAPVSGSFSKDRSDRTIQTEGLKAFTYGDGPFKITASTTEPTQADVWSYEVIYDEHVEPAVSVDNKGNAEIKNAGRSVVKITLSESGNDRYYNDAEAYVTVVVDRAPLHVSSFAEKDGKKVTEAVYGTLEDLTYGISYKEEDFKYSDNKDNFTKGHGTLKAEPLHKTTGVAKDPHKIRIVKEGGDKNIFICRNYDLIFDTGSLKVTPAALTVKAEDTTGIWGSSPLYTYTISDGAPWDTAEMIFEEQPSVVLDEKKAGGTYEELLPGTYKNVLMVQNGKQKANDFGGENYTITTKTGDLVIQKAPVTLTVKAESRTYDKKPAEVKVTTEAAGTYDGQILYTYYELKDKNEVKLKEAPTDAGSYKLTVSAGENDRYLAAEDSTYFDILKALPTPKIPKLADLTYKEGLTLAEEELPKQWEWLDPDMKLEVGSVYAEGEYTPEDTRNYKKVTEVLGFKVNPTIAATAEPEQDKAVLHAASQRGARIYYLQGDKGKAPSLKELLETGSAADTTEGKADITLKNLKPDTEYTFYLAADLNDCTSEICEVTFRTEKREDKPEDKPDGKPDDKPDGKPDDQPDGKPDGKPDHKPDGKPDNKPGNKPGSKPGKKPGVLPKTGDEADVAEWLLLGSLAAGFILIKRRKIR